MVRIEIINEVIPDNLTRRTFATECIGDKAQVLFQCFFTESLLNKLHKTTYDIILKIFIITNRDDGVLVRLECRYLDASHVPPA